MDRSTRHATSRFLVGVMAACLLAAQGGCVGALATALWVVRGHDVEADWNGLRGKRVAVVCRPLVELQYSTGSRSAQELAEKLGQLLAVKVRKIDVVDPRQVAEWTDEHEWDDIAEVGKALHADLVVAIDLEEFSLYQSQTLYQGKARMHVNVYDVATGEIVYPKAIPQVVYPPNRGVDTSVPEDEFRRRFVAHLADVVGRHFYKHDSMADFALDSKSFGEE